MQGAYTPVAQHYKTHTHTHPTKTTWFTQDMFQETGVFHVACTGYNALCLSRTQRGATHDTMPYGNRAATCSRRMTFRSSDNVCARAEANKTNIDQDVPLRTNIPFPAFMRDKRESLSHCRPLRGPLRPPRGRISPPNQITPSRKCRPLCRRTRGAWRSSEGTEGGWASAKVTAHDNVMQNRSIGSAARHNVSSTVELSTPTL